MRYLLALTMVVCLFPALAVAQSEPANKKAAPPKAVRTDRYGDPLPEHAKMRLGSIRLQYSGYTYGLGNSPDGKIVAISAHEEKENTLRFLDSTTGKQIAKWGIVHESNNGSYSIDNPVFTPDCKEIFFAYKSSIQQREWASGKLKRTFDISSQFGQFALSPDGKLLAAQSREFLPDAPIHVFEVATGRKLTPFAGRGMNARVQFSADGKRLWSWSQLPYLDKAGNVTSVGGPGPCVACIWDAATRRKLHEVKLKDYVQTVAFSPEGNIIAIRAGENIDIVQMASSKTQCHIASDTKEFRFTPDGKAIVTVTDDIRLWDSTTGKLIRRFKGHVAQTPHIIGFSAEGKLLTVGIKIENSDTGVILHWNVSTGEPAWRADGHEDEVTCVAWAPDGKTLASGSRDKTIRIWDATSGKSRNVLQCQDEVAAIVFSPDGKRLASSGPDGTQLWNAATGKLLAKLQGATKAAGSLAFTSNGRTLVGRTNISPFQTYVWELERSHHAQVLTDSEKSESASSVLSKDARWTLTISGVSTYGSPAMGLRLANACDNKSRLNVCVGKASEKWPDTRFTAVTLSDDGRTLVASEESVLLGFKAWQTKFRHRYRFWDRLTGEEFLTIDGTPTPRIALSSDNRLLATAHGGTTLFGGFFSDTSISVWNTLDGSLVHKFPGHASVALAIAFNPDGRHLVSASADRTLLIWNTDGFNPRKAAPPATAKQIEKWWKDLAGGSAVAHKAIAQLVLRPNQAVPWIADRTQPTPSPDAKATQTLIVQLGNERFVERQRAAAALEDLKELAEPQLREALATAKSLEQRRRVEVLLDRLSVKPLSPSQLQSLRAVAVLEGIGTAPACKALQLLAQGEPAAHQTRAARAALERLTKGPR